MNTTTLRQWCQLNQNDAWLGVYWSTNDYGDIKRDSTCVDIFWSLLCLHLNMSLICLYDHGLGLSFSFLLCCREEDGCLLFSLCVPSLGDSIHFHSFDQPPCLGAGVGGATSPCSLHLRPMNFQLRVSQMEGVVPPSTSLSSSCLLFHSGWCGHRLGSLFDWSPSVIPLPGSRLMSHRRFYWKIIHSTHLFIPLRHIPQIWLSTPTPVDIPWSPRHLLPQLLHPSMRHPWWASG